MSGMKVTNFGPGGFPLATSGWSSGITSLNSNVNTEDGGLSALNFVQGITANGSNMLLRPIANFAAGSNILLTLDAGPGNSIPSNTIRIHSTATGGAGSGTLNTVEEVDGSPTDSAVTKLVFPNGTLSIVSHVATYTPTGGSGGSLIYLTTLTASASAQLDATSFITGSYTNYVFHFVDIIPATNTVQFLMRVGTGAGPTYDTGGNYHYSMVQSDSSGASGTRAGAGATSFELGNSWDNTAAYGGSGQVIWFNPGGGTNRPKFTQEHARLTGGALLASSGGGLYNTTTAITAIRFFFSSGNITSGSILVYGVKNS